MRICLYLHHDFRMLAERWLQDQDASIAVTLLHDQADAAEAKQLAEAHTKIDRVVAIDDEATACAALAESIATQPRVVLPLSPDNVVLRYHAPTQMPALQAYYPLIRRLWRIGFREFELTNLGGSRVIQVPHLLDDVHNLHQGKRCFVIGNGPSLNQIDMGLLRDEITLGSNRCFLGYENWGFPFQYWGIYDKFQIQEYHREYETEVPDHAMKFFPAEYLSFLHLSQGCPVNVTWPRDAPRRFSGVPDEVYVGHTVTYMLLQIAAIMGCNPIILLGADHRYNLDRKYVVSKGMRRARRTLTRKLRDSPIYDMLFAAQEARLKAKARQSGAVSETLWDAAHARDATHFDARYTRGGRNRFLPPEPEEAERDFECAERWGREHQVQILNATPNSALTVFPMVDYDSLF